MTMKVRFWGVRGSIPSPGDHTRRYGGNTACIELRVNGRLIIIDAGSGIRALGNSLLASDLPNGPINADIFLSHTHWDHIMGFPFFAPIYIPGCVLRVHGPVTSEDDPLEEVVGGQMTYRYFPINMGELASTVTYERLQENPGLDLGEGLKLRTRMLNHPVTALAYRFEFEGMTFCTCYDTEPWRNLFVLNSDDPNWDEAMAEEGALVAEEMNAALEEFYAGADLLVYDAQYTEEEYSSQRMDWGHSSMEYAIKAAARGNVKKLALFHHDPDRSDDDLDAFAKHYCVPREDGMEVFFAREGMEINLGKEGS
jgi:phosphoribosyl 1,2-cyclic phosphodiesterase